MTSDELERDLVRMKIRVFVLQELLLSTFVSVNRGGGGVTLRQGQDQAKLRLERARIAIQKKFSDSERWKALPEPKHLVAELVQHEIDDLSSRIGASDG